MVISIAKFGHVLTARDDGKEAFASLAPKLKTLNDKEEIIVDFAGLGVLSPGWADEFITPLTERFGSRVTLRESDNASVILTLETLKKFPHGG